MSVAFKFKISFFNVLLIKNSMGQKGYKTVLSFVSSKHFLFIFIHLDFLFALPGEDCLYQLP